MPRDIWMNLPVTHLKRSVEFFEAIGFTRNPGPGNTDHSASFVVGEKNVVLMLFADDVFSNFTGKPVAPSSDFADALFSLGADSREEVDAMAKKVEEAGGVAFSEPQESNGFMYGFGFRDLDGHSWNVLYMDTDTMAE